MNYILHFEDFNSDQNNLEPINEGLMETLQKFKDKIENILSKRKGKNEKEIGKEIIENTIEGVKGLSEDAKRARIRLVVAALISFSTISFVQDLFRTPDVPKELIEMSDEILNFRKASEFKTDGHGISPRGVEHIKKFEGYREKVYSIGDGKLTVGWGHAESRKKTKLRKGQTISKSQAEEYLKEDLKEASDGVKRIFKEWEAEGINVKITQSMFDALVSLAYNCGVYGLREGKVMKVLKTGNYEKTAKVIKNFKVSVKYPGLKKRRLAESELFLSDYNSPKKIYKL